MRDEYIGAGGNGPRKDIPGFRVLESPVSGLSRPGRAVNLELPATWKSNCRHFILKIDD